MTTDTGLLTDHYELTMVRAALRNGTAHRRAVFEVFARHLPNGRRYGVVAGTGRLLDALEQFRFGDAELAFLERAQIADGPTLDFLRDYRFHGDISGYAEGDCYFPGSPILVVEGTFAEAVVLETLALSIFNHDCAIASAASRMVTAAHGRPLVEMGSRRTHERAAVASARAAYITGFTTTSNLRAGYEYGVPTSGTSAHAFTLLHDDEARAFAAQVDSLGPGTTLLVDTYDVPAAVARRDRDRGSRASARSGSTAATWPRWRARRARSSTRSARPRPGSSSPATWMSSRSPRSPPSRSTATGSARRSLPGQARRPPRSSTSSSRGPTAKRQDRCARSRSDRSASRHAAAASGRCASSTSPGTRPPRS